MSRLSEATELERWTRLTMRKWHGGMSGRLKNGLPGPQYYMLEVLREHGMMSCSDIAGSLGITLPAVTNLTNKLVAGGYAQRVPSQTDRRSVLIRITEDGLEAIKELDDQAQKMVAEMWQALDPAESETLVRLLRKALKPNAVAGTSAEKLLSVEKEKRTH